MGGCAFGGGPGPTATAPGSTTSTTPDPVPPGTEAPSDDGALASPRPLPECEYLDEPVLGDPASDWARYALRAPVMLVHTPDAVPVSQWVPFADWADGRVLLDDRRPTMADLDYHLTTLFPPVRPRGFLEVRYLDSVPEDTWPAVVFMLATLLDDPVAADAAAEATEPVATAWDRAAQLGLEDRRLHTAAMRCVQAAAERVPDPLEESMSLLARSVEQGRSPADDFADRAVRYGIARAVTQLAQGEM